MKSYREYMQNFKLFQRNEPDAITSVLRKKCKEESLHDIKLKKCCGFKIYPSKKFFPIDYSHWTDLFSTDPKIVNKTMEEVKDAIAIYLWNSFSVNKKINNSGPVSAYKMLAEINCPKVFATVSQGAVF